MKVMSLDGKQYTINLSQYTENTRNSSSLHKKVREELKEIFPFTFICEEVFLPGIDGLYLDFLIPSYSIAIECQGEQHYKFNSFFFKDKLSFYKAQTRDKKKKQWCEINSIRLVEVTYKDDKIERTAKIKGHDRTT